jgi:hypothetical protein
MLALKQLQSIISFVRHSGNTYLVPMVKEMIALIHKLLNTLHNLEITVLKDGIKG